MDAWTLLFVLAHVQWCMALPQPGIVVYGQFHAPGFPAVPLCMQTGAMLAAVESYPPPPGVSQFEAIPPRLSAMQMALQPFTPFTLPPPACKPNHPPELLLQWVMLGTWTSGSSSCVRPEVMLILSALTAVMPPHPLAASVACFV